MVQATELCSSAPAASRAPMAEAHPSTWAGGPREQRCALSVVARGSLDAALVAVPVTAVVRYGFCYLPFFRGKCFITNHVTVLL